MTTLSLHNDDGKTRWGYLDVTEDSDEIERLERELASAKAAVTTRYICRAPISWHSDPITQELVYTSAFRGTRECRSIEELLDADWIEPAQAGAS